MQVFILNVPIVIRYWKDKEHPKINLEGINSIQPLCSGEKPWEMELDDESLTPNDRCYIRAEEKAGREKMKDFISNS